MNRYATRHVKEAASIKFCCTNPIYSDQYSDVGMFLLLKFLLCSNVRDLFTEYCDVILIGLEQKDAENFYCLSTVCFRTYADGSIGFYGFKTDLFSFEAYSIIALMPLFWQAHDEGLLECAVGRTIEVSFDDTKFRLFIDGKEYDKPAPTLEKYCAQRKATLNVRCVA